MVAEAWAISKTDCAYEGLNALCEKLGHLDGWPLPLRHLILAAWYGLVLVKLMIIINFRWPWCLEGILSVVP